MRLERYVSQSLSRSRKHVRALIGAGRVQVNGNIVREAGYQIVQHSDEVRLDGDKLGGPGGHRLLMMNKPRGCITARRSAEHATVMEHIPTDLWHAKLFPVGRLDKDTTGLLLFTTDGGINQLLLHPRRHVEKAYTVTLKAPIGENAEEVFASGLELSDGSICKPAKLERIDDLHVRVIVTEGRFHQVKRMIGHVGGHVVGLHRERIGAVTLDDDLGPGQCRALTDAERDALVGDARERGRRSKTTPAPADGGRQRRRRQRPGRGGRR